MTWALRMAALTGDWVTPYAMTMVIAQWDAGEIDRTGGGEW